MDKTPPEKDAQIRNAIIAGNLPRLESLAVKSPRCFEGLRYGNHSNDNLVDLALANHRYDVAIYLIIAHGFEVSPEFECAKKHAGEYGANGCNEYFQTLEVLANLVLGCPIDDQHARSPACYKLRNWATAVSGKELPSDSDTSETPADAQINPEFIRLVTSGVLTKFSAHKMADERHEMTRIGHPITMLRALSENAYAIQEHCKKMDSAVRSKHPRITSYAPDGPSPRGL